jgi:hypothetical protein
MKQQKNFDRYSIAINHNENIILLDNETNKKIELNKTESEHFSYFVDMLGGSSTINTLTTQKFIEEFFEENNSNTEEV